LTLNGVTKEVVLEMTKPSSAVKDPWGNTRIGFSATGKIVRKDFGIVWNKVLDKGGLTVGEDVFVNLEMELTEKK
jgi:polyisoprenoid-binding protein YceI